MPSASTSARDSAPTSSQRSSAVTSAVSAGVLGREVSVRYGNHAGDGSGGRQHAYLLRLELLVPQRMSGSAADPMEPQSSHRP